MRKNLIIFLLIIVCGFIFMTTILLKFDNEILLNGKGIFGIPIRINEYENSKLKMVYSRIKIDESEDTLIEQIDRLDKMVGNKSDLSKNWRTSYGVISVIIVNNKVFSKNVILNNQIRREITDTMLDKIEIDMSYNDVSKILSNPLEFGEYKDTDNKVVKLYRWISIKEFNEYDPVSNCNPKGHVLIIGVKEGKVISINKY